MARLVGHVSSSLDSSARMANYYRLTSFKLQTVDNTNVYHTWMIDVKSVENSQYSPVDVQMCMQIYTAIVILLFRGFRSTLKKGCWTLKLAECPPF